MVDFLFYLFSGVILASGAMVVACRKPVTAAMFLLVAMAGTAAAFFLLEAFFLGILQILVYAGAVVVLFLFIIIRVICRLISAFGRIRNLRRFFIFRLFRSGDNRRNTSCSLLIYLL